LTPGIRPGGNIPCSLHEAQRNAGIHGSDLPDFAALHPGYAAAIMVHGQIITISCMIGLTRASRGASFA
jgi:hypothetical protein